VLVNRMQTQIANNTLSFSDLNKLIAFSSSQETAVEASIKDAVATLTSLKDHLVDADAAIAQINDALQSRATQIQAALAAKNKKSKFAQFIGTASKVMNVVNVCFPNPYTLGIAVALDVTNAVNSVKAGASLSDMVPQLTKVLGPLKSDGATIVSKIDTTVNNIFNVSWTGDITA